MDRKSALGEPHDWRNRMDRKFGKIQSPAPGAGNFEGWGIWERIQSPTPVSPKPWNALGSGEDTGFSPPEPKSGSLRSRVRRLPLVILRGGGFGENPESDACDP